MQFKAILASVCFFVVSVSAFVPRHYGNHHPPSWQPPPGNNQHPPGNNQPPPGNGNEGTYSGDATFFYTGLGSCGERTLDSEHIAALSQQEIERGARCGRRIQVNYGGRSIVANVVDTCMGCSQYSVDLSPSAFDALASEQQGRIKVTWSYI